MLESKKEGLKGTIRVPGDKSISHRSIIFGAISHGETKIDNFLKSKDCLTTIKAFQALGVSIKEKNGRLIVSGQGIDRLHASIHPLDMENSGTTTRLIMGILAGQNFNTQLVGDLSLSKRPMQRIANPLHQMNGKIEMEKGILPAKVYGKPLNGIDYKMPIASAQVKSAIILAALQARTITNIYEPFPARDHTERMLELFSPDSIKRIDHHIMIFPNHQLKAKEIKVPGDISSAAFFMVAATIISDSKVKIKDVNLNPTRAGILNVMKRMGANIEIENYRNELEPTADLIVQSAFLNPTNIDESEVPTLIDEIPLIALLASCANGKSQITGAKELRYKESDRIQVIVSEFQKLGIAIQELPDGFIIDGSQKWQVNDSKLNSHLDHRIAMTLAIAALKCGEDITIQDAECIDISYPDFFKDLKRLRS